MKEYLEAEKQDLRRRRREKYIIVSLMIAISLATTYLGMQLFEPRVNLPVSNTILIFALININVILLLLLLFLTMRNLVKLLFERKNRIMGARLRTKLVLAFITLSLFPTIILFFASVLFMSTSIEYWFNLPIEKALENSRQMGRAYYNRVTDETLSYGNNLSRLITYNGYMLVSKKDEAEKFVNEKRKEYRLASIKVFSSKMKLRAMSQDEKIDLSPFKNPDEKKLRESFEKGTDTQDFQSSEHGELVSGIIPVFSRTESKAVVGLVVLEQFIPGAMVNQLTTLSRGLEEYKQLKLLKQPIKITQIVWVAIVTLTIIFLSIWFGFYFSKNITIPIQELAEGTNRIASGDYDFFIDLESEDEMGVLVNSFNRMTLDLKNSKQQLEEANEELIGSNLELEQRRLYMETILANVGAGVISADAHGMIFTINKSAERMLQIKGSDIIGQHFKNVIGKDHMKIIRELLKERSLLKKGFLERQIRLPVGNKTLSLLVSLNVLRDDKGRYLGMVAVLEDLTEIERAQRMAAWREVAKRIAHEVKNPLTPIQLSAQRIKKRYRHQVDEKDGKVFEECTDMIVNQVEELKRLVNEFSSFARMPASNPMPHDIGRIVRDAMSLYKEARKNVKIVFNESSPVPIIKFDKEQIKRVMINLLDNAIDAIDGEGEILIDLSYQKEQEMVRIEVEDNGKGISAEDKIRLFEPYFSTKKQGTGLGLAIVNTIITDHNGSIRIEDKEPIGSRFIVELPVAV